MVGEITAYKQDRFRGSREIIQKLEGAITVLTHLKESMGRNGMDQEAQDAAEDALLAAGQLKVIFQKATEPTVAEGGSIKWMRALQGNPKIANDLVRAENLAQTVMTGMEKALGAAGDEVADSFASMKVMSDITHNDSGVVHTYALGEDTGDGSKKFVGATMDLNESRVALFRVRQEFKQYDLVDSARTIADTLKRNLEGRVQALGGYRTM